MIDSSTERQKIYENIYRRQRSHFNLHDRINGLNYHWELAGAHGADYYVFYPKGTPDVVIKSAESEARTRFDVATFTAIEIQPDWDNDLL